MNRQQRSSCHRAIRGTIHVSTSADCSLRQPELANSWQFSNTHVIQIAQVMLYIKHTLSGDLLTSLFIKDMWKFRFLSRTNQISLTTFLSESSMFLVYIYRTVGWTSQLNYVCKRLFNRPIFSRLFQFKKIPQGNFWDLLRGLFRGRMHFPPPKQQHQRIVQILIILNENDRKKKLDTPEKYLIPMLINQKNFPNHSCILIRCLIGLLLAL